MHTQLKVWQLSMGRATFASVSVGLRVSWPSGRCVSCRHVATCCIVLSCASLILGSDGLVRGVCVAVCCSVLQCVAVCCSVLQCVAVCCSELVLFKGLLA